MEISRSTIFAAAFLVGVASQGGAQTTPTPQSCMPSPTGSPVATGTLRTCSPTPTFTPTGTLPATATGTPSQVPTIPTNTPVQLFPTEQVLGDAPLDNRVNIVFMSSGYTQCQLDSGLFVEDVEEMLTELYLEFPFNEYGSYFNAFTISVPSNRSGAGIGQCGPNWVDNAFSVNISDNNPQFLVVGDQDGARNTALLNVPGIVPPGSGYQDPGDMLVAFTNLAEQPNPVGSGGWPSAVVSWGPPGLFLHEVVGHSFAYFTDERSGNEPHCNNPANPDYTAPQHRNAQRWNYSLQNKRAYHDGNPAIDFPNASPPLSPLPIPNPVKWAEWIDPETIVPTEGAGPQIGLWSGLGNHYCSGGMVRATRVSRMSNLGEEWNSPQKQWIIHSIYKRVDILDHSLTSPGPSGFVRMGNRASKDFSVTWADGMQTASDSVEVRLSTTHYPYQTQQAPFPDWTLSYHYSGFGNQEGTYQVSGSGSISAVAQDTTTLVRVDPDSDLTEAYDWTLEVVCTADCNDNEVVSQTEEDVAVDVLLGDQGLNSCPNADDDGDGKVSAREISDAVYNKIYSCSTAFPQAASSSNPTVLTIGTTQAPAGQVVNVPISVSGGNRIFMFQLDLVYDPNLISPTNPSSPCTLDAALSTHSIVSSVGSAGGGYDRVRIFVSDTVNPRYSFGDGPVGSCQFTIDSGASAPTAVPVSCANVQVIGNPTGALERNQLPLPLTMVDGAVGVCSGCGCL